MTSINKPMSQLARPIELAKRLRKIIDILATLHADGQTDKDIEMTPTGKLEQKMKSLVTLVTDGWKVKRILIPNI